METVVIKISGFKGGTHKVSTHVIEFFKQNFVRVYDPYIIEWPTSTAKNKRGEEMAVIFLEGSVKSLRNIYKKIKLDPDFQDKNMIYTKTQFVKTIKAQS